MIFKLLGYESGDRRFEVFMPLKIFLSNDNFLFRIQAIPYFSSPLNELVYRRFSFPFIAWNVFVFGVFLIRFFPQLDWIRRYTEYLFVFSPNARKCRPEKLRIRALFTQCFIRAFRMHFLFVWETKLNLVSNLS